MDAQTNEVKTTIFYYMNKYSTKSFLKTERRFNTRRKKGEKYPTATMLNATKKLETELPEVWRNLCFQSFKTLYLVNSSTPTRLGNSSRRLAGCESWERSSDRDGNAVLTLGPAHEWASPPGHGFVLLNRNWTWRRCSFLLLLEVFIYLFTFVFELISL